MVWGPLQNNNVCLDVFAHCVCLLFVFGHLFPATEQTCHSRGPPKQLLCQANPSFRVQSSPRRSGTRGLSSLRACCWISVHGGRLPFAKDGACDPKNLVVITCISANNIPSYWAWSDTAARQNGAFRADDAQLERQKGTRARFEVNPLVKFWVNSEDNKAGRGNCMSMSGNYLIEAHQTTHRPRSELHFNIGDGGGKDPSAFCLLFRI